MRRRDPQLSDIICEFLYINVRMSINEMASMMTERPVYLETRPYVDPCASRHPIVLYF